MSQLTAIICDIGGHDVALEDILRRLGADANSGYLPPDLSIIQVGDLVRLSHKRGYGSDRCVEIVDRFIETGRWIQIIGNHEVACIGGSTMPTWDDPTDCISDKTVDTLTRWWNMGLMHVAATAKIKGRSALVTHAGLTSNQHKNLGSPATPADAAAALNRVIGRHPKEWGVPGVLVTGVISPDADCLWADSASELYPSWQSCLMPFDQIHGHSQIFDWESNGWKVGISGSLRHMSDVDTDRRTVRFRQSDCSILGIDWTLTDPVSVPSILPPVLILNNRT
jgi:hypothetical protein